MNAEPSPLVVDASVVVDWVLGGPGAERALALAPAIAAGSLVPHAPDIWMAECANAVWKHVVRMRSLTTAQGAEAIERLTQTGIVTTTTRVLLGRAFAVARERECAFYDALYVALAVALDAPLATRDATLARHARQGGVPLYWE